jgi:hypothetical protein
MAAKGVSSAIRSRQRELQAALTKVAGFNRYGWPTSVGIGGRITSESLAALAGVTTVSSIVMVMKPLGGRR